jgi:hypothetical protein
MKTFLSAISTLALTAAVAAALTAAPTPALALSPAAAAQAAPAAPDTHGDTRINGKWKFTFDTAGGDRDFDAEFMVDADGKVTGTWAGKPATGTYKEGHLVMAFETHSDEAGETNTLQIDGKMDESMTVSGNWAFGSYDGTFKAVHAKP